MIEEQVVKLLQDIRNENAEYHQKIIEFQETHLTNQEKAIKAARRQQVIWYFFIACAALMFGLFLYNISTGGDVS